MDVITLIVTEGVKLQKLKKAMLSNPTKSNKDAYVDKMKYIATEAAKNKNEVDDRLVVDFIDKFMPALKSITTQVEYDIYHNDIMNVLCNTPSNIAFNKQCKADAKKAFNNNIKVEMEQFDGDIVVISDIYDELWDALKNAKYKTKIRRDTLIGCEINFVLHDNISNADIGNLYAETSDVYVLYKQDLLSTLNCRNIDDVLIKYMRATFNTNLNIADLRQNGNYSAICEIPNFTGIVKSYGYKIDENSDDYALCIEFKGINQKTNEPYDLTLKI